MDEIKLTIFILMTSSVCSAWTRSINCTAPDSKYTDYKLEMQSETFPHVNVLISAKGNHETKVFRGIGNYRQEFDLDTGKKTTGFVIRIGGEDLSNGNTFTIMFEDRVNLGSGAIDSKELTGKNGIVSAYCNREASL